MGKFSVEEGIIFVFLLWLFGGGTGLIIYHKFFYTKTETSEERIEKKLDTIIEILKKEGKDV